MGSTRQRFPESNWPTTETTANLTNRQTLHHAARRIVNTMKRSQLIAVGLSLMLAAGCNWITSNAPRPLAKAARLEVYLVSPTAVPNSQPAAYPDAGTTVYLVIPAITTSDDVVSVQKSDAQQPGVQTGLIVDFSPKGAQRLAAATTPPSGKSLAVVVDGEVVSVAKLVSTLSSGIHLSGGASSKRWEEIFNQLTRRD